MGDGKGLSGGDLLLEEGNHAAVTSEHVPKTDRDVIGTVDLEMVDEKFGDPLGDAHNAGGADCLIGGDHDEVGNTVLSGGESDIAGSDDVVLDGFEGMGFHHGDVLIGGGVVEDGRDRKSTRLNSSHRCISYAVF